MIKTVAFRTAFCATAILFSLGVSSTVKAETFTSDTGVAGISAILQTYYEATPKQELGAAEEYMETLSEENQDADEITKVVSPYEKLGISIANDYVNIRSEANTESEVVGKLYEGCAADILDESDGWVKIHSGNVKGYINKEFLAIGKDAEALIDKYATKYAVVTNTDTLRVRDKKSTDDDVSNTIALIPKGDSFLIVKEYDKWVEIQIDEGEGEDGGVTGFISKDYINIDVKFKYAVSVEEEQAMQEEAEAKKEAAEQAQKERLEQLAKEQEQERAEEQSRKDAAEKAAEKAEEARNDDSKSTESESSESHSGSSSGQAVADYAVKFVGNPYVYGGESLTNGTDCSGFVKSIYAQFGYSISRTSRDQSSSAGKEVSVNDLQAGDLVFYCNNSGTVNHVAMYIGGGRVVHASNQREGIKISNYNYRTPYKARRIIN